MGNDIPHDPPPAETARLDAALDVLSLDERDAFLGRTARELLRLR